MAGTSYTRQSTIADGNLITAALFNNEFNQIVNAFAYSASGTTGHTHDGSTAQGGAISKIGDQDFKNKIEVSVTNNRIEFYSEVGGAPVEQVRIQDGAIVPVTDSDVDLGTTSVRFKDAYVDSVTVTNNIVVAGTVDGRDVAADGTKLDGIEASATADQTDAEIRAAVEAATDSNVFTDADHTKLNAIEASATADQTDAEIRAAVEAATDSNVFTDADHTKLNAIEASADVTDTTNVTAAGALMDSEVTNLAQVKAFDSSDYATAAQGTTADAALPKAGGAMTGAITTNSTFDGRDVATDGTKLDGIEASADVTDATNVTAAGALMDSEVTNLAQVKAFNSADYATAAQGTTADAALPKAGGAMTGAITTNSTFDGRDVATDGTKLDGIEASADVTDATNVTAAGALMDSELTAIASVKALNQGVATTDSPTFTNLTLSGTDSVKVPSGTTAQRNGSPANGMFRYNSTTAEFEGYQNGAWGSIGGGTSDITLSQFTGDGSDTTFTLSGAASENNTFVFIDGVYQSKDNYTVSAANPAVVTFSTAPPNTTAIEVMVAAISVSNIGTPSDGTVTPAKIASGDFYFDTDTLFIDATNNRVGIGTTSPTSNLEVSDSTQATGATLSITNSHEGSWASGDKIGSIDFRIDDGSASEKVRAKVHSEGGTTGTFPSDSDLVFSTTSANTLSEAMRIDSTGVVEFKAGITEDSVTLTGTTTTIDLATATNFVHDLSGNTTYTFSNPASTGNASAFTLKIIQDSTARTITWPASVDWAGGTAPTLTATNNGVDIFTFFTLDGGTTYYGFTAGQAMA